MALVPLGDHGSLGLLALGSTDRDRFHPGMSTEFLARMAELITDALASLIPTLVSRRTRRLLERR